MSNLEKYKDIINLPHYRNPNRVPLQMSSRAAQFAPFAALSGHDEAIKATEKKVEEKYEEKYEDENNL